MTTQWLVAPEYAGARLIVQRLLALVYLIGFLNAALQFRALLGEHGLTPIPRLLRAVRFRRAPSVFHLHYSDRFFAVTAWFGAALSFGLLLGLTDLLPLPLALLAWAVPWALYLSIVNLGQLWYSYGWESLLLEAGFLAIFLGPSGSAPPAPVLWLLCWLLFRVEFGAGLIKMRGDPCWRDLTCLHYHHETQPMPGPLSWRFHHLPGWQHRWEVLANHFAQLVVPFGLFAPQPASSIAAAIVIVTQAWLMLSGNFAWLNLITITLAFSAIDDRTFRLLLPEGSLASTSDSMPVWFGAVLVGLAIAILVLSYWPVRNMLARGQVMNRSFNSLHLVNTYGAFAGITRNRDEIVLEGTHDPTGQTGWREYEFRGKPGDPARRPPQIAPYHLRLDWQMWFAAISPRFAEPWLPRLLQALLRGDARVPRLLRHNPFPDTPPQQVRARLYRYRYSTREERRRTGTWWHRTELGDYVPPVSLSDLAA